MKRRCMVPRKERFWWHCEFYFTARSAKLIRQLQAVDDILAALRGDK